jgi:NADPH:quinone reductase-like Zn-dependent oxidoreductase
MAVDLSQVANVDARPGDLPATMAAWVIRQEREGEPVDAFRVEEIEVPEPGAFEVVVRVMAAGVNFNNVWAALGQPVSVFRYHPECDHHIGGSDASGVVWKVGPGVTRWQPGDEVVMHCNQASYEDPEVHGLDPLAAPSQRIWGYETSWGSFAQFTKVQAQQLLPKPAHLAWEEAASYGLTYFTAYRMLLDRARLQAGQRVLIWGAAGGLGVFATQLCRAAGAECVGVVSSPQKGALVQQLGAKGFIDRSDFAGMMRRGGETPEEEKARFAVSRDFSKRVRQAVRQGRHLRSDVGLRPRLRRALPVDAPKGDHRLALRQRVGVQPRQPPDRGEQGAAGAVAYDGLRPGRGGSPAHVREQAPRQDRHPRRRHRRGPGPLGRRPRRDPRGGGRLMAGVVHIPWYATGLRGDKLEPALADVASVALRYGARSYSVFRYRDDRYKFLQTAEFEHKAQFERYWLGPEFTEFRVLCSSWYQVPVVYGWTDLVISGTLEPEPVARATSGVAGAEPGGDLAG